VYLFLFLYFRKHLKNFILKLVPQAEKSNTNKIIHASTSVAQKYLSGLSLMIVILWIMYGIGFSVAGVKNALFFAILCGLLETVPFIGNITGTALTVIASMATGGSSNVIIGILIVYGLVQFIQTYILEPLVVGKEISINPLFTIIGLVVGELVWGIPGMVMALPVLGMLKVIFDNIEPLKPYGFLIGSQKKESNLKDKLGKDFRKK
jgi:predicted PurR-regulated permease PerM